MNPLRFRLLGVSLLLAAAGPAASAAPAPVRIMMVGDSTMVDPAGWTPGLRIALVPQAEVINFARSGRSSKSYRDEGWWTKALAQKPDYMVIVFGGNDVPGKGPARETDPATTFSANLRRYVAEAEAAGIKPVLTTTMAHRDFDSAGHLKPDPMEPYAVAMRAVAAQTAVPLVDLYARSRALYERLGPEGSALLGRIIPDAKGVLVADSIHVGREGSLRIGALAARGIAEAVPALRPYFRPMPAPSDAGGGTRWEQSARRKETLIASLGPLHNLPNDAEKIRQLATAGIGEASLRFDGGPSEDASRAVAIAHEYGLKICLRIPARPEVIRTATRDIHADQLLFDDDNSKLCDDARRLDRHVAVGFVLKGDHPLVAGHFDFVSFDPTDSTASRIQFYRQARTLGLTLADSHGATDELSTAICMAFDFQKPLPNVGSLSGPLLLGGDCVFTPILEFYRHYDCRYYTNTESVAKTAAGPVITAEAPSTVAMEVLRRPVSRETILHAVNVDRREEMSPFAASVRKQYDGPVKTVIGLSPDRDNPQPVAFQEQGDRVSFTTPAGRVYQMVVIAQ